MGRLHWSGNFDEMQDFEQDIREHFGGSGFLTDEQYAQYSDPLGPTKAGLSSELDALSAYTEFLVDSLSSPYISSEEAEIAFENAGCVECHPAPLYTDSNMTDPIRHDIGTITDASGNRLGQFLDGIDTPSLIGVWNSAPYLHDGSAQSIGDAIQAHQGLPPITTEELNMIIEFVRSL